MSSTTTITRRFAAALLAAGLLLGVAACGSSDGSDGASGDPSPSGDSSSSGGTDTETTDGEAGAVDPCQWYTADEMEAILGFPVSMEDRSVGETVTCVYDAPDNYSSVEISPSDEVAFDTQKAFDASPDAVDMAGEPVTYDDLGDDAYGHESAGGVDINARKGSTSVLVLITNGGGGEGAGNISTPEDTLAVAKQIVTTVLG